MLLLWGLSDFPLPPLCGLCYGTGMFSGLHRLNRLRKVMAGLRVLTASGLFALTVFQGMTLCMCPPDPDTCGDACHECGSIPEPAGTHIEHVCEHLDINALTPGLPPSNPLDELLVTLFMAADFRSPMFDLRSPDLALHICGCPPDIQPAHLIYIARSVQILC